MNENTTTNTGTGTLVRGVPLRAPVRHYLEMVVAMIVGMVVLGPPAAGVARSRG